MGQANTVCDTKEKLSNTPTEMPKKGRCRNAHWTLALYNGDGTENRFTRFDNAINNPSSEFKKEIRYVVWQKELCPKTQKLHYQIYVQCHRSLDAPVVKKLFALTQDGDPEFQVKYKKSKPLEARVYCMKEETRVEGPWEYGTFIEGSGSRTDLAQGISLMDEGGISKLAQEMPELLIKYPRGMTVTYQERKKVQLQNRNRDFIKVVVIHGTTGVGKSHLATEISRLLDDGPYYSLEQPGFNRPMYWDGYDGHKILIIDEFKGWIPIGKMLRYLDKYAIQLDQRGTTTWAEFHTIIILSNFTVEEWYPQLDQTRLDALKRRIHLNLKMERDDDDVRKLYKYNEETRQYDISYREEELFDFLKVEYVDE